MSEESLTTFYHPEVKKRSVRVLGLDGEWYYGKVIEVIEEGGPGVVIYIPSVTPEQLLDKYMTETMIDRGRR